MKIGFELQLDEIPIFLKMAKILINDYNVRVSGVSLGKRYNEEIKNHPIINFNISEFLKYSFRKDITLDEIDGYVHKYGDLGLNRILFIDRVLSKKKYGELLHWVIGHLKFYEYYFAEERPDFFVSTMVAGMNQLSAYLVGKKLGIPYIGIGTTRIPNDRFVICRDLDDSWDTVNKIYSELNRIRKPASERAKSFIREFEKRPIRPKYMKTIWQACSIQKSHIKEFLNRAFSYYMKGWGFGNNRFDYWTYSPLYYAKRELIKMIKISLYGRSKKFKKYKEKEKFILFPLHLEPEATLDVQARFFTDQLSALENIAKCIPLNCLIYAKEHASAFGRRKDEFYRRISNIPNVKLIHPEENTIDLIKNAEMIITLSGTVGWEALLLKKPVIVLGNVFYNHSDLAIKVNSYEELEKAVSNILTDRRDKMNTGEYNEKLGRFVDAVFEGSYEGCWDLPLYNPEVLNSENIRLFVKGLMRDIKNLKNT